MTYASIEPSRAPIRRSSVAYLSDSATGTRPLIVVPFLSMGLLVLGCADDGLVGLTARLLWLASILFLSFTDIGGAFGLYIASVAIYNPLASGSWASPLERPDNCALVFIVAGLIFAGVKRDQTVASRRFTIIVGLFLIYGLVQMTLLGVATESAVGWFVRAYGALGLAVLLWRSKPCSRDLQRFATVVTLVGAYMAVTSLLQAAGHYDWVIPKWLSDTRLYPYDNNSIGAGRAGGLFMQSEFNGAALGLICCIVAASRRFARCAARRIACDVVLAMCLAAIYFTYTRGAWLAIAAGIFICLRPVFRFDRDRRTTAIRCVAALLLAVILAAIPDDRARNRIGDSENAYFRLNVWAAGLKMASERPAFGYGYGRFAAEMSTYHGPVGSIPYEVLASGGTVAHNVFVNILVEEGGVGLVLYLLFVLTLYRNAAEAASREWSKAGKSWVLAILAVYFINLQFISGYEPTSNLILFGSLAMIAGIRANRQLGSTGSNNRLDINPV